MDTILHPEYAKETLRYETNLEILTDLLCHHDDLLLQQSPTLEAKYLQVLGQLERDIYEQFIKAASLKRTISLAQAYLNRGIPINQKEITETLKREFHDYQDQLKRMTDNLDVAKKWLGSTILSVEETKHFKKLYIGLAKKLHPDLHPNQTGYEQALWLQAAEAYHCGDIQKLESLTLILEGREDLLTDETKADAIEKLKQKNKKLESQISAYQRKINVILQSFPFTMQELLKDEAALEARKDELRQQLAAYQQQVTELQAYVDFMQNPGPTRFS